MWKSARSAFSGNGDIDSVAPVGDLPLIEAEFVRWAAEQGVEPVITCPHAEPFMYVLIAVDRDQRSMLELDVTLRKTFRGSTLFLPKDLLPLMVVDHDGVRRIRSGAEGVILLVHNGMRRGGGVDRIGLKRKQIPELLTEDPIGVEAATGLFGRGASAAGEGARSVMHGSWNRRAMMTVEMWAVLGALRELDVLRARARFRFLTKRRCPILNRVYADRRIPGDVEAWMRIVIGTHTVYGWNEPGLDGASPPDQAREGVENSRSVLSLHLETLQPIESARAAARNR